MESVISDVRYALRSLRLNAAYTVIAVLCLALGIGTDTAIYSAVNAMILRPLGFRDPAQVMRIYETNPKLGVTDGAVSLATFANFAAQSTTLDGMAAFANRDVALGAIDGSGQARHVQSEVVSWNIFPLLGIQPQMGRTFDESESVVGKHHVAIISDKLWNEAFAADARILGKPISLDGSSYTVIGVMPPGMRFPETRDVWTPIAVDSMPARGQREFDVLARTKAGVTLAQANADIASIAARLARSYPTSNDGESARVAPFQQSFVDQFDTLLWTMLGAVSFVLLIACGNVANLMLARGTSRQHEIAVRMALGASRIRLVRQLLTESILISIAGGAFGVLLAVWGLDAIVQAIPYELPYWMHFDIDGRVLAYTLAISVGCGCLFGLVPALKSTTPDLNQTLKDGSRGTTSGAKHQRLRGALVVGQTALCLVLLIGASLMMRSFLRIQTVNPGFRTQGVLSADVMLPLGRFPTAAARLRFFIELRTRLAAAPGVTDASLTSYSPLSGSSSGTSYLVEGQPAAEGRRRSAEFHPVSGAYFSTLGISLRSGRSFSVAEDADTTARVAVVNESFVTRNFPGESALGKRLRWGSGSTWLTIVGVAPDVRQRDLKDRPIAQIYVPQATVTSRSVSVLVHTNGDPASLAPGLRAAVSAIDPVVPMYDVLSLEALRDRSMWQSRVFGGMFAVFGMVSLVLAAIGLYGVISYGVAQRSHELGVRMALGAQEKDVLSLVVRQGSQLAITGVAVGLPLALMVTKALRSQLYGVTATDPVSYVGISLMLAAIALVASYVPARRAANVDPMVALRSE